MNTVKSPDCLDILIFGAYAYNSFEHPYILACKKGLEKPVIFGHTVFAFYIFA